MENKEKQSICEPAFQDYLDSLKNQPSIGQCCLLCENTREFIGYLSSSGPWVCDECKEAIAFVKRKYV